MIKRLFEYSYYKFNEFVSSEKKSNFPNARQYFSIPIKINITKETISKNQD